MNTEPKRKKVGDVTFPLDRAEFRSANGELIGWVEPEDLMITPTAPPGSVYPLYCGRGHVWSPGHRCGKNRKRRGQPRKNRAQGVGLLDAIPDTGEFDCARSPLPPAGAGSGLTP